MISPPAIVVGSEAALSLYPILIKLVDTPLSSQILSRFLTFSVLAAALASPKALSKSWGSFPAAARSTALGTLSLAHVAASYYAFDRLPAGPAMALFYTYPIWNLLGGALFLNESISPLAMGLLGLAIAGVLMVSFGTKTPEDDKPVRWDGVAAALAAALTETGMYFAVRAAAMEDPYFSLLELYPGALIGLGAYFLLSKAPIDTRVSSWGPMVLFNIIVGFLGYALRYYAIPKVSTAVFSILSFVGVSASFLFGWLFAGEIPTVLSTAGASLITIASALAPQKA